ncbi:MAG TPA: AraC family transcriptional regulator [Devosiaceae bacterium]|jgi:AraC-like DNA-binding protein
MTAAAHSGAVRLTTAAEKPHRRAELAREVFGRQILRLDVEPLRQIDFEVDLGLHNLPDLKLITGWADGVTTPRTPELLADGNDDVMVSIGMTGQLVTEQGGRQEIVEAGTIRILRNSEPFSLTHRNSTAIGLAIPRRSLAPLVWRLDDRLARPLPRETSVLKLLQSYVTSLSSVSFELAPDAAAIAASHVHDLIAMILGIEGDAREIVTGRGLRAARLGAIKADIGRHLADVGLSVGAVAAAHRLTQRSVQRLFEEEGTTFSAYVLDQRLQRAHQMLRDPRYRHMTIGAIAGTAGFGDLPHFNHMFRRRYLATPSDIRAEVER